MFLPQYLSARGRPFWCFHCVKVWANTGIELYPFTFSYRRDPRERDNERPKTAWLRNADFSQRLTETMIGNHAAVFPHHNRVSSSELHSWDFSRLNMLVLFASFFFSFSFCFIILLNQQNRRKKIGPWIYGIFTLPCGTLFFLFPARGHEILKRQLPGNKRFEKSFVRFSFCDHTWIAAHTSWRRFQVGLRGFWNEQRRTRLLLGLQWATCAPVRNFFQGEF